MAYEYVAISGHPEDVISISIGNEAESYALAHYKGSLRHGLNPSTSGVLQNVTTMTSNTDTPTNDVPDECTSDTEKAVPALLELFQMNVTKTLEKAVPAPLELLMVTIQLQRKLYRHQSLVCQTLRLNLTWIQMTLMMNHWSKNVCYCLKDVGLERPFKGVVVCTRSEKEIGNRNI